MSFVDKQICCSIFEVNNYRISKELDLIVDKLLKR
jgi:hypothetical protein